MKARRMLAKAEPEFNRDTLLAPLIIMANNGVPLRTFVDIGSADGTFGLTVLDSVGPGLNLLNIDAQDTYEPSLKKVHALLGEPYYITALADHEGMINVGQPQHEYWLSTAFGGGRQIPCKTLDSVWADAKLPSPCFIKIDVEGGKFSVLKGAEKTLQECCGLLIESPVRDANGPQFIQIYEYLAARDFLLFDILRLSYRGTDAALYQFYSAFIAKRYDFRGAKPLRSTAQQAEVFASVTERRRALIADNAQLISNIKLKRAQLTR
ncbi:MAG: FkbM family methyltransferase [Rhodospirillaceae bacterium]|nr:FkbM family methyltransferase [Rhodospirillaceae bacterium]